MWKQKKFGGFGYYNDKIRIPVKSDGIASLQLLTRIKVNTCINDRYSLKQLNISQILKDWLNKFYVMDNDDKLLARKFNATVKNLKMTTDLGEKSWHLSICYSDG